MLKERRALLPLVIAACALTACHLFVARFLVPREGIREPTHGVRTERRVELTTSDGVVLRADVFHPKVTGPTPTVLVRIPVTSTFQNDLATDAAGRFWASRGYTAVIQGTRGRRDSDGAFYPLRDERSDGIDTLRWLARQPWFDGRLGMWGGSTFGYTQWVLADQSDPGPRALMIQIASTDFHGMFYPGGAFSLESALYWAVRSHGTEDVFPTEEELERGFAGWPVVEADDRVIGDVPFFDDWATHSERDAYWQEIDGTDRAGRARAPALMMAGWYDPFLPGQLRDYETLKRSADPRIAEGTRLIVGPWMHARELHFPDGTIADEYRAAALAPSIAWFDHQLLGRPLDGALRAPVRIFVLGENVWRDESEWPLARARETTFFLASGGRANSVRGDGRLRDTRPEAPASDQFTYDPSQPVPTRGGAMLGFRAGIAEQSDVEARDDVLVYSTEPLAKDLEVTGPIRAVLWVATSAPSTDFTAKLVDVHPDGSAYNVSDGILRRTYDSRSPTEIQIELWPTSMLFRAGHRIRLEVSSSNYPRYDRNPNTGGVTATARGGTPARQKVAHGADFPSRLILPVVPRE